MTTPTLQEKDLESENDESAGRLAPGLGKSLVYKKTGKKRLSVQYKPTTEEVDAFIKQQEISLSGSVKKKQELDAELTTKNELYTKRLSTEIEPSQEEVDRFILTKESELQSSEGSQQEGEAEVGSEAEPQEKSEEEGDEPTNGEEEPEEDEDDEDEEEGDGKDDDEKEESKDNETDKEKGSDKDEYDKNQQDSLADSKANPEERQRQGDLNKLNQDQQAKPESGQSPASDLPKLEDVEIPPEYQLPANPIQAETQLATRRALYWAYGALFTLVGSIPAFIYLNIHLWKARKGGSKYFAPLKIWDKFAIALLDFVVMLALLLIPMIIVGGAVAYCNTWTGWGTSKLSGAVSLVTGGPGDFCKYLAIDESTGGASGGGGASGSWQGKITIAITGSYRPGERTARGGPSAHGRGESIDIALRDPRIALYSTDPRIDQIISIARGVGFVSPAGDALDEYASPAANATAGHIHLEFNTKADGSSYCDNGAPVPLPPTDLVDLTTVTGSLEVTASDPRVRPCMRDAVARFLAELEKQSTATE